MEETIQKFIDYLKGVKEICNENVRLAMEENAQFTVEGRDVTIEDLKNDKLKVEQLLYFLISDKKILFENRQVFVNYFYMSDLLESSPLNAREKMEIIIHIVEKNLSVFASESYRCSIIFDADIFKNLYAQNMSYEEFQNLLKNLDTTRLLNSKKEELTKEEQMIKEKLLEAIRLSEKKSQAIITCHNLIDKHYFKKLDTYTEKDIKFVSVALSKLGIWDNIVGSIFRILSKNVEKRKQKTRPKLENGS